MDVPQESTRNPLLIGALAYVPALFSMMSVGLLVPFVQPLSEQFVTTPAAVGLAIALFSVPTAIFATLGGGLVDRFGHRRSLLVSLSLAAIASLLASRTSSTLTLDLAMLLAGFAYGGVCVTAPALLMTLLQGAPRTRALAFLSTYPPAGYSAGLLLAAIVSTQASWRVAFLIHAGLMVASLLFVVRFLPETAASAASHAAPQPLGAVLRTLRQFSVLRLGLAVALPNAVSYGTSLAAPSYLARVYGLSIATSSIAVATAKIVAMVIGGLFMGHLLARSSRTTLLFAVMVGVGLAAQVLIFIPLGGIAVSTGALVLWIFAFGGMAGGAMALMPAVTRDPGSSGAVSGVVNQFISVASFAAPSTWLALHDGTQFVGLAAVFLLISLAALPRPRAIPRDHGVPM